MFQFSSLLSKSEADPARRPQGADDPRPPTPSPPNDSAPAEEGAADCITERVRRDLNEQMERLARLLDRVESLDFDREAAESELFSLAPQLGPETVAPEKLAPEPQIKVQLPPTSVQFDQLGTDATRTSDGRLRAKPTCTSAHSIQPVAAATRTPGRQGTSDRAGIVQDYDSTSGNFDRAASQAAHSERSAEPAPAAPTATSPATKPSKRTSARGDSDARRARRAGAEAAPGSTGVVADLSLSVLDHSGIGDHTAGVHVQVVENDFLAPSPAGASTGAELSLEASSKPLDPNGPSRFLSARVLNILAIIGGLLTIATIAYVASDLSSWFSTAP